MIQNVFSSVTEVITNVLSIFGSVAETLLGNILVQIVLGIIILGIVIGLVMYFIKRIKFYNEYKHDLNPWSKYRRRNAVKFFFTGGIYKK